MPGGWERINVRKSQPNKNIAFIKPRPGHDEATSRDYLERIAAQCLPVMNKNYLSVVSLEEYEPNLEFWGRNFNNGEVIQLVLKSPSTGRWLPFKFVQMVMMHELAHCKEMNHSKAFWKVRNGLAEEMKVLWGQQYSGEGLWGRGVLLENGEFSREELGEGEVLPEHMCGGTFRSRGRGKRKVKPKITYKEAKERRIRKKFGVNGVTLGADDETKVKLEKGKKPAGKPRVAGSARGRELRAAAALARFEVTKTEQQIKDEELVTDSETESDYEEVKIKPEPDDAVDINGERLLDSKGNGMVRVCEDEDNNDVDAQNELSELQGMAQPVKGERNPNGTGLHLWSIPAKEPDPSTEAGLPPTTNAASDSKPLPKEPVVASKREPPSTSKTKHLPSASPVSPAHASATDRTAQAGTCPVCSFENEAISLCCMMCSNVLKPEFVAGSWRCESSSCKDSGYINAGDVGLCGVCSARKTPGVHD